MVRLVRLAWLLVGAPLAFAPPAAWAQLTAEPSGLAVTVPQGETVTRTVTLANAGAEPITFCVAFDRPLQRAAGRARLAEGTAGGDEPCGVYGEVLYYLGEDEVEESGWFPYGITMTPEGRLFTSSSSGLHRTFELTPELQYVGWFEHPRVAELTPFAATLGVTFDPESASGEGSGEGALWWMNLEQQDNHTRRVLLLEGTLDGEPTGRRIEIVPPDEPLADFYVGGPSYDVATDLFYFLGISDDRNDLDNWKLWAVDREGNVPEGYPLRSEPYPEGRPGEVTVHGGAVGGPGGTPGASVWSTGCSLPPDRAVTVSSS